MKRLLAGGVLGVVLLALFSGYRAWFQVRSVEIETTAASLVPGVMVHARAVTSGRTVVTLSLELVQGDKRVQLALTEVPKNGDAAFDPRSQQADLVRLLTPSDFTGFDSGPALLRATATGRPQWMRTPPPTMQEIPVRLGAR